MILAARETVMKTYVNAFERKRRRHRIYWMLGANLVMVALTGMYVLAVGYQDWIDQGLHRVLGARFGVFKFAVKGETVMPTDPAPVPLSASHDESSSSASNWWPSLSSGSQARSVPEPGTLLLLTPAAMLLMRRHRPASK